VREKGRPSIVPRDAVVFRSRLVRKRVRGAKGLSGREAGFTPGEGRPRTLLRREGGESNGLAQRGWKPREPRRCGLGVDKCKNYVKREIGRKGNRRNEGGGTPKTNGGSLEWRGGTKRKLNRRNAIHPRSARKTEEEKLRRNQKEHSPKHFRKKIC